jgi:hypothetical protein
MAANGGLVTPLGPGLGACDGAITSISTAISIGGCRQRADNGLKVSNHEVECGRWRKLGDLLGERESGVTTLLSYGSKKPDKRKGAKESKGIELKPKCRLRCAGSQQHFEDKEASQVG